MSFRTNDSQQLSFSDTLYGLTPREQKALQNSWAKVFAEDIFPKQTIVENGKRRLKTKEDGTMNSDMLQNPTDPDATYREKAEKQLSKGKGKTCYNRDFDR